MSMRFLQQIRTAISNLDPDQIRQLATRPVRVLVQAGSSASYAAIEDFLAPARLSTGKRMETAHVLVRACDSSVEGRFQLAFFERGTPLPEGWEFNVDAFIFDTAHPDRLVRDAVDLGGIVGEDGEGLPGRHRFHDHSDVIRRVDANSDLHV